jgi:hypothetical protein
LSGMQVAPVSVTVLTKQHNFSASRGSNVFKLGSDTLHSSALLEASNAANISKSHK